MFKSPPPLVTASAKRRSCVQTPTVRAATPIPSPSSRVFSSRTPTPLTLASLSFTDRAASAFCPIDTTEYPNEPDNRPPSASISRPLPLSSQYRQIVANSPSPRPVSAPLPVQCSPAPSVDRKISHLFPSSNSSFTPIMAPKPVQFNNFHPNFSINDDFSIKKRMVVVIKNIDLDAINEPGLLEPLHFRSWPSAGLFSVFNTLNELPDLVIQEFKNVWHSIINNQSKNVFCNSYCYLCLYKFSTREVSIICRIGKNTNKEMELLLLVFGEFNLTGDYVEKLVSNHKHSLYLINQEGISQFFESICHSFSVYYPMFFASNEFIFDYSVLNRHVLFDRKVINQAQSNNVIRSIKYSFEGLLFPFMYKQFCFKLSFSNVEVIFTAFEGTKWFNFACKNQVAGKSLVSGDKPLTISKFSVRDGKTSMNTTA
ncbi:hypothetical protein P9112_007245 [Eukaryota sp. TZLM1-RC]